MSGNEVLYVKSSKKKSKMESASSSANEDEVWDDSLLIQAYSKAVDRAHANVLKMMSNSSENLNDNTGKSNKKNQWCVGGQCRCEYSEDNKYYEADIIDIIDDLEMCVVKYVGYENEEKAPLSKLKPSKGETARSLQIKQALQDKGGRGGPSADKQSGSGSHHQTGKKKYVPKKPGNSKNKETISLDHLKSQYLSSSHLFKPPLMGAIPPPPPPHMFAELGDSAPETEAMSAMLMSWYMSGYHTGYYQGLKAAKK